MSKKPSYEELEQRVKEFEQANVDRQNGYESLQEIFKQYQALGDIVPYGFWLTDGDGLCTYVSKLFLELVDMTMEQFQEFGWLHLLPNEDVEPTKEQWLHCVETGQHFRKEHRFSTKEGDYRNILAIGRPIKNDTGKIVEWVGLNLDITDLKRAEHEAVESENRYHILFNEIDEGFCIIEMIFDENEKPIDYRFLEINPAFEKQTGLINAQGKRMRPLAPKHEDHWFEIYGRIAVTGQAERFVNRAEQLNRWYDVYAFRFGQPENRQVAILFNDITGNKQMEEELRESEKRFRDISHSMADWIWEVDKKGHYTFVSDTVKTILGYDAHELIGKTPFDLMPEEECAKIKTSFFKITSRSQPIRDLENWNLAKDGTRVCLLTNGIPIFDKDGELQGYRGVDKDITRQKQNEAEKALINDQLRQAQKMESVGRLAGGVAHDYNNALTTIMGYTELAIIDQILANLCVNARDAIEDVGKITIETATKVFDSDYCADHKGFVPGEFVMLTISDNGFGMDKEILNNIFEPFFTTKDVDKGTGLGLSTVYGIVKQNNGFINVYSEPGKGTAIKIYLPRQGEEAVETQKEKTAEIPQGQGETILLVEDDLSILKLAQKILEGLNYTVLIAGTPKEGIKLAEDHTGEIHLLVTDVIMPEMNGLEISKQLKSLYPDLNCVFMSGYTANVIVRHGVLDEGVHFIQKPFSKSDLATIIRKALDEGES